MDPSQEQEEASPSTVETLDSNAVLAPSPTAELNMNETLNIARAFNTTGRDASNSSLEVQENFSLVLQNGSNLRLNSLAPRSIATSTPFDSANPSPKPPLKNQSPSLSLPRNSGLSFCSPNCSEISSINSEVFLDSEPFNPQESHLIKQPPIAPPSRIIQSLTMDEAAAEEEIVLRGQDLDIEIQAYPPDVIDETDVDDKTYLAKIEEVDRILKDVLKMVGKLLYKFPNNGRRQNFEELTRKALSDVKKFKVDVKAKVSEVKRNMTSSSVASTAPLAHPLPGGESDFKAIAQAMEKANTIAVSQTAEAKRMEREKSVMKATSIYDNLKTDIKKFGRKITDIDVDEWTDKDDNAVSKGMRKLDKWEDELKDITTMLRQLVDLKNVHNILENEVECDDIVSEVQEIEVAFKEIKEKLEAEDEERGLYSLEKPRTTSKNLPTFSGKDSEDFSKFKLDMEDGFKANRVSKKEQIQKLRECLKGQARKLVPDSNVTDVKTAWEILKKAFGNPIKIIKQRKEALLKLGEMPSGKVKGQKDLRPQIAWFIEVTTFLKELIELGKKNSEYRDLAFN